MRESGEKEKRKRERLVNLRLIEGFTCATINVHNNNRN